MMDDLAMIVLHLYSEQLNLNIQDSIHLHFHWLCSLEIQEGMNKIY